MSAASRKLMARLWANHREQPVMPPPTKITRERLDAGHYRYRGFDIQDHGAGRSVNAAMNRGGSRWKVRKIIGPGYFDSEYVQGTSTLNEAIKWIDAKVQQ